MFDSPENNSLSKKELRQKGFKRKQTFEDQTAQNNPFYSKKRSKKNDYSHNDSLNQANNGKTYVISFLE